jgi:protein-S-isoprenylcysteine O-methyltransferase Ste14
MSFVSASKPLARSAPLSVAPAAMPPSIANQWVMLSGLAMLLVAGAIVVLLRVPAIVGAVGIMATYAAVVLGLELGVLKAHRRPTTGIDWTAGATRDFVWRRIAIKCAGLTLSIAAVIGAHWLLRLYSVADMKLVGSVALLLAPSAFLIAIPYIAYVDRGMIEPRDGYWHAGQLALGRWDEVDWKVLREHFLGWTIKGFFLPIMVVYLIKDVAGLQHTVAGMDNSLESAIRWLTLCVSAMELTIVSVGYLCTLRIADAHIRSPNPLLGAWLVTLVCYEPFNRVATGQILRYDTGHYWYDWFGNLPAIAFPWALAIILSFATWLWATACFGVRWSNLTNRGIITNGPYRFTKHPDYVSKSIFFWLINVPFLSLGGPVTAIQTSLLLAGVNLIYFGRARAEEKHLSADPVYVAYATAMNERSVFRGVARLIPALRYRSPA